MNRRHFVSISLAALAAAHPALADGYSDQVARQLRKQGFTRISVQRTLLGRSRIVASGAKGRREIILNPRTGEILRDLWTPAKGGSNDGRALVERDDGDNSGKGSSGDDDDDDDDGGNSGSGGGDDDKSRDRSDDGKDDGKDDDGKDDSGRGSDDDD